MQPPFGQKAKYRMKPISSVLNKRQGPTWSVQPNDSVYHALEILAEHEVGALMVMTGDQLVGIVSERDYTRKIALQGKNSKAETVASIMTANVATVTPQTDTRTCMTLMRERKIRHLPVMDGTKVLGMVSIRDLMDDIIEDSEQTINQLENYIKS